MSNIVLLPMCMCFLRVRKYKLMSSAMCKCSHLIVQVVLFIAGFFYYKRDLFCHVVVMVCGVLETLNPSIRRSHSLIEEGLFPRLMFIFHPLSFWDEVFSTILD